MNEIRIQNGNLTLTGLRSGRSEAPAVLFLHGITSAADSWRESMARLGDRFDCWALDFRGHGDAGRVSEPPLIADYASDAAAALRDIGRPAIVVGHSLGGISAAHLAHERHPLVKALFLEDPPLFLGDGAFASTLYPQLFTMLRQAVAELQAEKPSPERYLDFASNSPSPMGGRAADHTTPRQLASRAFSLARFQPSVLDSAIDGRLFVGLDPNRPIVVPVTLLAANPTYGAAFLDGDAENLLRYTPHAVVVPFPEVGHNVRGSKLSEGRFLDLLDSFASANG